jgi:membrane protein YqaA with SNARE-associated domain
MVVAFVWGLAEATCFFLVPDVFLTLVACRDLRAALRASVVALAGALLGGGIMVALGAGAPESVRGFLTGIPGIHSGTIAAVQSEFDIHGLAAVLRGPWLGIPYKIYAVEWGARGGGIVPFLLISLPARYARFLLATLLAGGIAGVATRRTHRHAVAPALWAAFWTIFYVAYLARVGW